MRGGQRRREGLEDSGGSERQSRSRGRCGKKRRGEERKVQKRTEDEEGRREK